MTIRGLIWLALLFAFAVIIATVGGFNGGQILLVMPPYRVDVSLNLFVVALVVLFIVLYGIIRAVRGVWKMPARVAAYRARSKLAKANASLRDAIGHLYAGRFSKAERPRATRFPPNQQGRGRAHRRERGASSARVRAPRRMARASCRHGLAGRAPDGDRRHARRWP